MEPRLFYNTIGLTDRELLEEYQKASSLEVAIMVFFANNPERAYTPFDVQELMGTSKNINSVRRAMTNLTQCEKRFLIKTGERRMGKEGKMNYCWRFNPNCMGGEQTKLFG
jgi:hypothetical protein